MSIQLSDRSTQPVEPERPHGLLTASPRVLEMAARENAKVLPLIVAPDAQKRDLDNLILDDYFEHLDGIDIAYRSVPEGVEVLAVGFAEVTAFRKTLTDEERQTIKIRQF